jgi:NitT/TauT family transport system ATP-binding protein
MPGAEIKVNSLNKSYESKVLADLSFSVSPGQSLVFLGPSGCGKTTILHILAGLIEPDSGDVTLTPERSTLSLVMQDLALFPWKNAFKNLELPLCLAGMKKSERTLKVCGMLDDLGLSGLDNRYLSQLSGGQRQRLALGRSLIARPDLLLLDEPFSSLDAITKVTQEDLLAELWKKLGFTLILSTHSLDEALYFGNEIIVLGGNPTQILDIFSNKLVSQRISKQISPDDLAGRIIKSLSNTTTGKTTISF